MLLFYGEEDNKLRMKTVTGSLESRHESHFIVKLINNIYISAVTITMQSYKGEVDLLNILYISQIIKLYVMYINIKLYHNKSKYPRSLTTNDNKHI